MKTLLNFDTTTCMVLCIFLLQFTPHCKCSRKNKKPTSPPILDVQTTSEPEEIVSEATPILEKISKVSLTNPDSVTLRLFRGISSEKVENSNPDDNGKSKKFFYRALAREVSNTTLFLQGTDFNITNPSSKFLDGSPPSLLHTVYSAYKNHHNLVLRPDDVWLAILTQFSYYVNKHSEELRHLFVTFDGKKKLWVNYTNMPSVAIVPFDDMIDKMVDLVEKNVNANLSLWILPNFTTTTRNDMVTSGSILLATVQNYFEYNLWLSACGIPQLTLLGRREDWIDIRERIDKLPNFEIKGENLMEKWSSQLGLVLDQFIKVKTTGQVDHEFWEGIVQHGRYWAVCTANDFVDGWITVFAPFNRDGIWIGKNYNGGRYKDYCEIKDDDKATRSMLGRNGRKKNKSKKQNFREQVYKEYNKVLSSPWNTIHFEELTTIDGQVKFPLKITDDNVADEKDREYEGTVHAGYMGHSVEEDQVTLKPIMGWVIALHGKRPPYLDSLQLGGDK